MFTLALLTTTVFAWPGGAPGCVYPSSLLMSSSKTGTGHFVLQVSSETYLPSQKLNVTLSNSASEYRGFLVHAVVGNEPFRNVVGAWAVIQDGYQTLKGCGVTQTMARRNAPQCKDVFSFIAPSQNVGPITFYAVGVISTGEWYGKSDYIQLSIQARVIAGGNVTTNSTTEPSVVIIPSPVYCWFWIFCF